MLIFKTFGQYVYFYSFSRIRLCCRCHAQEKIPAFWFGCSQFSRPFFFNIYTAYGRYLKFKGSIPRRKIHPQFKNLCCGTSSHLERNELSCPLQDSDFSANLFFSVRMIFCISVNNRKFIWQQKSTCLISVLSLASCRASRRLIRRFSISFLRAIFFNFLSIKCSPENFSNVLLKSNDSPKNALNAPQTDFFNNFVIFWNPRSLPKSSKNHENLKIYA